MPTTAVKTTDWSEAASRSAPIYEAMMPFLNRDWFAIHFGHWGPDTTSEDEAMSRAIHNLVRGCDLGSGRRVLDAGCGLGITAISLAEMYGVHVIGLTNCELQVEVATGHARRRGVGHLVEFHYGDFMDLRYPDAHFDAVLNHESLCYAPDKAAYFRGVRRVLRPGGRWQALDATLSGAPLSADWEAIHTRVQEGYGMSPWEPWRDIIAALREAGFNRIQEHDMAIEIMPSWSSCGGT